MMDIETAQESAYRIALDADILNTLLKSPKDGKINVSEAFAASKHIMRAITELNDALGAINRRQNNSDVEIQKQRLLNEKEAQKVLDNIEAMHQKYRAPKFSLSENGD